MKQPLFLLLAILTTFTASAQQPAKDTAPLVYLGIASTLSTIIPIASGLKHRQKAIDIYNGAD